MFALLGYAMQWAYPRGKPLTLIVAVVTCDGMPCAVGMLSLRNVWLGEAPLD